MPATAGHDVGRVRVGAAAAALLLVAAVARVVADLVRVLRADDVALARRLPDDAWYYLVIGRNLGAGNGPTFDGRHRTNGFQPLWQTVEGVLATVFHGSALVRAALVVGMVMVVVACALVVRALSLPPVAAALVAVIVTSPPVWARCVDGMETPVVLLTVALLVVAAGRWWSAPSLRTAMVLGVAGGSCVLARLSAAPLVLLVLLVLLGARRSSGTIRAVAGAAIGGAAMTLPWIAWSAVTVGTIVPQGAAVKSRWSREMVGAPGSWAALRKAWAVVTEELWRQVTPLVPYLEDVPTPVRRVLLIVVLAAGVWGIVSLARRRPRLAAVVLLPLAVVPARFVFEASAQPTQVPIWYGASTHLVAAVLVAVVATEFWRRWGASAGTAVRWGVAVALLAISVPIVLQSDDRPDGDWGVANLEAARFVREERPGSSVGAFDAGMVGWAAPGAVNLDGLVREPAFARRASTVRPADLVRSSGLDLLVGRMPDDDARIPACAEWVWSSPTEARIAGEVLPVSVWELSDCR